MEFCMSKIKAWFDLFREQYFSLNLKDYPNIGADVEIVKLMLLVAVALCVAFCLMDYHKKNMYLTVKQLMRHEATDEASAKTVGELGLSGKKAVCRALIGSSQMRSVVAMAGEQKMTYEELVEAEKAKAEAKCKAFIDGGVDFSNARFYIKAEGRDRASRIYNGAEITVLRTALRCVLTVVVFVCLIFVMPEFLNWVNDVMG